MKAPIVLITGGGRGIGAAVARGAAQRGYDVAISYLSDEAAANAVAADIRLLGRRALAVRADTADEAQTMQLFAQVDQELGRLDAVVINAGIVGRADQVVNFSAERLQRILQINVFGAFITAREAIRRMSPAFGGAGGNIVNVSSAAARLGAGKEYVDYAATKGAIDTMTIGLAKELADQKIRVNAVRPGLILTDIHASGGRPDRVAELSHTVPMQRGGTAQEVAETILWLMSDSASYVTGALLDVAGGR